MDLTAITFTELRYVVAVADTGHFGRDAERCHVSQPTLSTQVKKLEETLGVRIFERVAKRVRPTAVGERIVARDQREPLTGALRLGVIPTLDEAGLRILAAFIRARVPRAARAVKVAREAGRAAS